MTSKNTWARWAGIALACIALVACGGGGGGDESPAPPPPVSALIGAAGGTVTGPNDATVVIPAGALATDVNITVARTNAGAPALPSGVTAFGAMFAFTPHGTTFATPVTVTVPFDPALVPAGVQPALYKTNTGEQAFELVSGASVVGSALVAQVSSFSLIVAGSPPVNGVQRGLPIRSFSFDNELELGVPESGPKPNDPGGELRETRSFGASFFNIDGDALRNLEVFSSADGVTFYASAEDVGTAELRQHQKFIKRSNDATLEFIITAGRLEAGDANQLPSQTTCPLGLDVASCHPIVAQIYFEAEAVTPLGELVAGSNSQPVLHTGGWLNLRGRVDEWEFFAAPSALHTTPPFTLASFSASFGDLNRNPKAELASNIVLKVDLSTLDVGDEFLVRTQLIARAVNQSGRESTVVALLRDPAKTGGSAMNFTGLEPVDSGTDVPSTPRPKARCDGAPDPAAGTLQFGAATFAVLEERYAGITGGGIVVTRTGGSRGAVSARFDAAGGTASPGVHYTPLSVHVHFPDGDTQPRVVPLEVLTNTVVEPNRTLNLTLSDAGGCALLGTQATAVLTIRDDDGPPPPPAPSGLDTSFGNLGETVFDLFGGRRSSMALQADGKIVMAGGTLQDFMLARFNADGSIDRSFGPTGDGKVTTDMGSGFITEESTAVAVQADGKIVLVGYTAIDNAPPNPDGPPTFALARYNTDGSLDTGFGRQGRVSGNVNGRARAVAIQPDGRIVVAGEFSFNSPNGGGFGTDFSDLTIARFSPDGNLDPTFGADATGQIVRDLGGSNTATNIVLQPDGKIVVSGKGQSDGTSDDQTDVARFNADGSFDDSFGTGGKLKLQGELVGEGLARQPDGKLVLVGSVVQPIAPSSIRFVLLRLNANGTPDNGFGTAGNGKVDTAFTQNARANAVALQADGKIVVVGTSAIVSVSEFVVARYNLNGTLDTGFGVAGTLEIDFFNAGAEGENVLVQPDGKIVVSGFAGKSTGGGYGVARILP